MLKIVNVSKSSYNSLNDIIKHQPETLFLCKDDSTGLCSIYSDGRCYGEDIDEESLDSRISSVELELQKFTIATNFDIVDILKS